MNRRLLLAASAFVLLLAGCGDRSPDSPLAPATPQLNGGYVVGGNSMEPATEPSDTAGSRNGGYVVGGN